MGNRQFHRSFIIMKAWSTGYGLYEGKEPAGYCKMEIKNNNGKLQLYIQDMKPTESQQNIYDVVLISNKEEISPVKLTSIQIPEGGKGEYEINFEPDDVRQCGYDIGQYHALAVVDRPLKLDKALRFPLVGYSDKKVEFNWTDDVSKQLMEIYGVPGLSKKDVTKIQNQKKEVEQNHVLQIRDESDELVLEQGYFKQKFVDLQEHQEHQEYIEDAQEVEEDSLSLATDILQEQDQEKLDEISKLEGTQVMDGENLKVTDEVGHNTYWNQVESYYNGLFDKHKKVTPFDDAVAEVDWIRVENQNEWYLPHQAYAAYNPYRYDENRLDHYLVGLVRNLGKVEYVVYAIPGIYSAIPPMSMHGFSRWLPVKNGYGAGYWLLYIDVKTGNIAYPY
ncbi:MAG: hypothetical protein GX815_11000 [Clostridiales bacterium]|nr:hypothetical protein [Clostridiales bacterium]